MAATARVVVLMSPEEKAQLDAKAARAGSRSVGELIRRAIDAYDESDQAEAKELAALLEVFRTTHAETMRQLDQTERKLDETLAYFAKARS
jgi:hypothetical protein